jgi:hypothetical protein
MDKSGFERFAELMLFENWALFSNLNRGKLKVYFFSLAVLAKRCKLASQSWVSG